MAKSKVPIARIEDADSSFAVQGKPQDADGVVVVSSKTGKRPEVPTVSTSIETPTKSDATEATTASKVVEGPAATTAATVKISVAASEASSAAQAAGVSSAAQPYAASEPASAKPTQEARSERVRTKVVTEPQVKVQDADSGIGGSNAAQHASAAPAVESAPAPEEAPAEPGASSTSAPKGFLSWLASVSSGHAFAVIGGICGLVVALLFFFIGFWKTLLICLLVFVGVALGQYLDGDPKILNLIRELVIEARGNN